MLDKLLAPYAGIGELILRLALGITFIAHGWHKLKNPVGFAEFLKQISVPAPLLSAWLVALLETGGAVLLIVGLATRVIAFGLAIDMLVAIVTVRASKAPFVSGPQASGWDLEFLLLMTALGSVLTGAGPLAVDAYLGL